MIKVEHNVQTGEIAEIEMTAAEVKEVQKLKADAEKANSEADAAAAQKAADRAAVLTQLGITEEQAKLLLG
jgi:hypothetical protein